MTHPLIEMIGKGLEVVALMCPDSEYDHCGKQGRDKLSKLEELQK